MNASETELNCKWIVVTGAARGIGKAVAELAMEAGFGVVGIDKSGFMPSMLGSNGFIGVQADVCDERSWESLRELLDEREAVSSRMSGLVNCAGVIVDGDGGIDTANPFVWKTTLDTNLMGTMLASKFCLPFLRRGAHSAIVNVSSVTAMIGSDEPQLAYTASKGAVVSFSRELAVTEIRNGVRVNCVCPGLTDTPLIGELNGGTTSRSTGIPIGRIAFAEEVAAVIVFLLSPLASYVVGSVVCVDGGLTAVNASTVFRRLGQPNGFAK